MARPKNEFDENEVEEIIELKLIELGGLKSKLSYNNVWNFNKKLVYDNVKRENGNFFNLYGYSFWASDYDGKEYYGRRKIDEIKKSNRVILAGESFNQDNEDLLIIIDKFKNNSKELSTRIIQAFERDRKKNKLLKEQNQKLIDEVHKLRDIIKKFELGFTTVFYNSIFTDNSLNDVMSLKLSGDEYVRDELKKMFNNDEDRLNKILNGINNDINSQKSIIGFHDKIKAKKDLIDLFKEKKD